MNTLGLKQDVINHDDGQTGGGLSLVFRSQYYCEGLKTSKHQSLELDLWKLNIKGIHIVVLGIYRPPYSACNKISDNEAVDDLLNCLTDILPNHSNIIIMGDLNFHWNDLASPLIHVLDDSIQALGLDQVVDQPMHKNGNILDLIMIEDWQNDREYKVQVGDFLLDHRFVSLQLSLIKKSVSYKHVMTRNLKELNRVSFKEKLATINLNTPNASATQLAETYDNKILEILNDRAPIKNRLIKERVPKPWFNDEIDQIRKIYRKCHTSWIKTQCETDWQAVQKAQNAYVKALNQAKKLHFSTKIREAKRNLKKLYNTINGLTNRVKNNPMPEGYTDQELANHFLDDFHNKVRTIADGMKHIPNYVPAIRNVPQLCKFDEVDIDTIRSIIMKIGLKQCEQDALPVSLIKENIDWITEHMHVIINKSLQTGTFPQSWKRALVKPLIKSLKNGTANKNYIPVSNLKFFSKLIESAALQQIVHHCEKYNLLPQNQSAYRKGYSCETMLIKLADNILNGMENRDISAVIACDLSAAFDTVNFEVLLTEFLDSFSTG